MTSVPSPEPRRPLAALVSIGLVGMMLSGCFPTEDGARAELEKHAALVDAAAQDALDAIEVADLSGAHAAGSLDSCGGSLGGWGVAYRAGASAEVGEDHHAAVEKVAAELQALGWDYEGELGGDHPSARLTRADITIDVKTGGRTASHTVHDADKLTVGIFSFSPCVKIPESTDSDDYAEFEREILPRE